MADYEAAESGGPESDRVDEISIDETARRKFAEDTECRGEAVPAGEPLPPGATHEVVEEDEQKVLRRKRFSAY